MPPPDRRTLFSEENQKYWDVMGRFRPPTMTPEERAHIQRYIDWEDGVGMGPFRLWLRKYIRVWKNGVSWRTCWKHLGTFSVRGNIHDTYFVWDRVKKWDRTKKKPPGDYIYTRFLRVRPERVVFTQRYYVWIHIGPYAVDIPKRER